ENRKVRLTKQTSMAAAGESSMNKVERIHRALILGIRDYFQKQNFSKALLGLSGGIDSAIVLCLAAEALGSENVKSLLMPSEYSSKGSVDDSVLLADNLGTPYEIISIQPLFLSYLETLR